ncbi:GTPase Der [Nymphon striatum]|nr:GTPase Der [Nymphon striatum]
MSSLCCSTLMKTITDQDAHLLGLVLDAGRSLVVAINKWDGLDEYAKDQIKVKLEVKLPFLDFADKHFISALHGTGVGHLYKSVHEAYDSAMLDVPTARMTRILQTATEAHQLPIVATRRIKLRYAHQGGSNPFTLSFMVKIEFKTGDNPFEGKGDKRAKLSPSQMYRKKKKNPHTARNAGANKTSKEEEKIKGYIQAVLWESVNIKGLISILLISITLSLSHVAFAKLPVGMNTNEIQHVDSSAPFVNHLTAPGTKSTRDHPNPFLIGANRAHPMEKFYIEFLQNWDRITEGGFNNPENFKSAWAHIHNLFENADINDSVEWVWCASATSTDDYDDLTVYYPGDDLVDWTSLDGFNRGNKPIILAEVGSAEPSDLPNPEWEQYGDDSDASNSKEEWVSDMFNRIRQDYPAIRAISWFNNNKELSWALNDIAQNGLPNTGLSAYNSSILHDHYLSSLVPLPGFEIDNDNDLDTTTHIRRGRNNPERSKTRPALKFFIKTSIQRAIALSKMPKVVGEKLREKEATGFRNLSQEALSRITMKRLSLSK